jgi:hypothetical protein
VEKIMRDTLSKLRDDILFDKPILLEEDKNPIV